MSEQKKTRGRPRKSELDIRNCTVNINVTALEKWKISDIAEKKGVTVSDLLRTILDKSLKENEL